MRLLNAVEHVKSGIQMNAVITQLLSISESACPLRTQNYGGIPGSGGFGNATEFEVGLALIAESLHCILGALGNFWSSWGETLRSVRGHIDEEMGLIESYLGDYSRPVYRDMLLSNSNGYGDKTVAHIRVVAPKLCKLAQSNSASLKSQTDIPDPVKQVAILCYDILEMLSIVSEESVRDYPDKVKNPWADQRVVSRVRALRKAIKAMYASVGIGA